MHPLGTAASVVCWHCGQAVDTEGETPAARYLYRGDAPTTVIVETWLLCACGAYQNARRVNEIRIEPLGSDPG